MWLNVRTFNHVYGYRAYVVKRAEPIECVCAPPFYRQKSIEGAAVPPGHFIDYLA